MITFNENELQNATAEELVEQGVGLIARGLFRKGDQNHENNPKEAVDMGESVMNVIRDIVWGFRRKCVD